MSDRPQGPGWWEASDLKWYPPEERSNYAAPARSNQSPQPAAATSFSSNRVKTWVVVVGLAWLVVTGVLLAGRIMLPGLLVPCLVLLGMIAVVALAVLSGQPVQAKIITAASVVLVVGLAAPMSSYVAYPAYQHLFGGGGGGGGGGSGTRSAGGGSRTTAPDSSLPQPKLAIDGQPQRLEGPAVCVPDSNNFITVTIRVEAADDVFVTLTRDGSIVEMVRLRNLTSPSDVAAGTNQMMVLQRGVTHDGQASATHDGNSYKVTGVISGDHLDAEANRPKYPFAIDFSCPAG